MTSLQTPTQTLAAAATPVSARRSDSSRRQSSDSSCRQPLARLFALLAFALIAAGCSAGPGSKAEFVDVLTRGDALSESQAQCVTDAVFEEYEADEDALSKISAAPSYEFLSSEEGVAGFTEFFDRSVANCALVGPAG